MADLEFDPTLRPVALLARLSSKRLPAKALLPFGRDVLISSVADGGSPALHLSGTVAVTSDHKSDDPLVKWYVANHLCGGARRMLQADEDLAAHLVSSGPALVGLQSTLKRQF